MSGVWNVRDLDVLNEPNAAGLHVAHDTHHA